MWNDYHPNDLKGQSGLASTIEYSGATLLQLRVIECKYK